MLSSSELSLLNTSWFRIDELKGILRPILFCQTPLDTKLTVSDIKPMGFTTNTVRTNTST